MGKVEFSNFRFEVFKNPRFRRENVLESKQIPASSYNHLEQHVVNYDLRRRYSEISRDSRIYINMKITAKKTEFINYCRGRGRPTERNSIKTGAAPEINSKILPELKRREKSFRFIFGWHLIQFSNTNNNRIRNKKERSRKFKTS